MKISAFTFIRDAVKFDFPIIESINSVLDIVDEYIIVAGDSTDGTNELIKSIDSPKIKIIHTVWDKVKYSENGQIYAHQTDLALRACSGDWCIYVQSDEVVHHDSLETIKQACRTHLDNHKVEGLVFKYTHFYGDYHHYIDALHFAYPREVRVVRNTPDIHSWRDAQSFRVIKDFDGQNYCQEENTRKLNCVLIDAHMYHYGWARDPRLMVKKMQEQNKVYDPNKKLVPTQDYHDYGNISAFPTFKGTHPISMLKTVSHCPWQHCLRYEGDKPDIKKIFGAKYRLLRLIEKYILRNGRTIGAFSNYKLISGKR